MSDNDWDNIWERLLCYLSISPSLSLLFSSAFSCLLFGRQGGDWRKKASLSPIPNPQQALKHMNGGGPAAALSRCPNLSIILSLLQQRQQSHRSWCTVKAEKGAQHRLLVCPALCALRLGDPSHTANAPLLPSLLQLVCGGRYFYLCNNLPDAALLRKWSFLWLCLYPSLPGKGREVMEVGVGCCRCCWSRSPPLSHSLSLQFTSLHITHTHTNTPRFGQITRGWGTKGRRCQFVSSPEQALPLSQNCQRTGQPASPNSPKLTLPHIVSNGYTDKTSTYT